MTELNYMTDRDRQTDKKPVRSTYEQTKGKLIIYWGGGGEGGRGSRGSHGFQGDGGNQSTSTKYKGEGELWNIDC